MRQIILVGFLAVLVSLAGCSYYPPIIGSGNTVTLTYTYTDFTAIQTSQSFTVRVVPDTVYSISVSYDDNLASYLVVEKQGSSTLVIGLKDGYSYQNVSLSAVVHMPAVASLDASGASVFLVESGFASTPSLTIALSGASSCQGADIVCTDLVADVSGASSVTLTGSADSITSDVSGASTAHFLACPTGFAEIDLSGASQGWVDVPTGSIAATVSGASTLYYGGSPSFSSLDLSGASRLVKVD